MKKSVPNSRWSYSQSKSTFKWRNIKFAYLSFKLRNKSVLKGAIQHFTARFQQLSCRKLRMRTKKNQLWKKGYNRGKAKIVSLYFLAWELTLSQPNWFLACPFLQIKINRSMRRATANCLRLTPSEAKVPTLIQNSLMIKTKISPLKR